MDKKTKSKILKIAKDSRKWLETFIENLEKDEWVTDWKDGNRPWGFTCGYCAIATMAIYRKITDTFESESLKLVPTIVNADNGDCSWHAFLRIEDTKVKNSWILDITADQFDKNEIEFFEFDEDYGYYPWFWDYVCCENLIEGHENFLEEMENWDPTMNPKTYGIS
jgi:hypothetical protein